MPKILGGAAAPVSLIGLRVVGGHVSQALGAAKYSPPLPDGKYSYIMVQGLVQNIRYTLDGATSPTATVGFQLIASDPPLLIPVTDNVFPQFIIEVAGAILQYQWMV